MTIRDDRVREVLANSGMSQGEFAAAIGLDGPKLSKSLNGTRRFSSLDIARIADIGQVSVDWLLGGDEPIIAMAARRSAGSASAAATAAAEEFTELREIAADLGYPQQVVPLKIDLSRASPRRSGEQLAEAALGAIGNPDHLLGAGLADLVEARFGVDVVVTALGDRFDGLAVYAPEAKLILAAPTAVPARQRFTVAHELAHVLLGDDQGVHLDEDVWAPTGKEPSEVRANAFAASFLMPTSLIHDRVGPGFQTRDFAQLAIDFQVSPQTLAVRLETLNLIDKIAASSFKRMSLAEAAQLTDRSREVAALSATSQAERPPKALAEALFAAYSAGATTLRPYALAIGADPERLRDELESKAED